MFFSYYNITILQYYYYYCNRRHIREKGLQKMCIKDPEFALHIFILPALAFVPQHRVIKYFEKPLDTDFFLKMKNF